MVGVDRKWFKVMVEGDHFEGMKGVGGLSVKRNGTLRIFSVMGSGDRCKFRVSRNSCKIKERAHNYGVISCAGIMQMSGFECNCKDENCSRRRQTKGADAMMHHDDVFALEILLTKSNSDYESKAKHAGDEVKPNFWMCSRDRVNRCFIIELRKKELQM